MAERLQMLGRQLREMVLAVLATELQYLMALFTTLATPIAFSSSQTPDTTALRPAMLLSPGLGSCGLLLTSCSLLFTLQPCTFCLRAGKGRLYFTSRPPMWGTAEWERQSSVCSSLNELATTCRGIVVSSTIIPSPQTKRPLHHAQFLFPGACWSLLTLLDSSAYACIIYWVTLGFDETTPT